MNHTVSKKSMTFDAVSLTLSSNNRIINAFAGLLLTFFYDAMVCFGNNYKHKPTPNTLIAATGLRQLSICAALQWLDCSQIGNGV